MLKSNRQLEVVEVHGFFFNLEDISELFHNMGSCKQLRVLKLSNNNIQDYGVQFLAGMLQNQKLSKLKSLTLHNNNIGDEGALFLAECLE